MKRLLRKFTEAEQITNQLEKQLESDPGNEELNKKYDEAYKIEFDAYIALANKIVDFTNGKITFDMAKKIIATKTAELTSLLELTE